MGKKYTVTSMLLCACSLTALKAQSITGLDIVTAGTNPATLIKPLVNGDTVNTATSPAFSIRANTTGSLANVRFEVNGVILRTEATAPYALNGDIAGNFNAWNPGTGTYVIRAFPTAVGSTGPGPVFQRTINLTGNVVPPTSEGIVLAGETNATGAYKKWHRITLTQDGPLAQETGGTVNPFTNYRMNVRFTHPTSGKSYVVPGYFAADGNAAETSATSGNKWRANFAADEVGTWNYEVDFVSGPNISVEFTGGTAVAPFDGKTGTFQVAATDKTGRDNRAKGRLYYVGQRYLRYAETNEHFVKAGPDSPETLLAYQDFDDAATNGVKTYTPHIADWRTGDPTWKGGKGRGLIGAVNYLASEGLNTMSFIPYNNGGDGNNVWPHVSKSNKLAFDCSKLDQWEIYFDYADRNGFFLHFKTQERENDDNNGPGAAQALDGGNLGLQRKLYYRELVARFGHHLALNWNLGEENTQSTAVRIQMAQYFADLDPYKGNGFRRHIVIHNFPGPNTGTPPIDQPGSMYPPLLGNASQLTGPAIQTADVNVHRDTLFWINQSKNTPRPWVVCNDEQGPASVGIPPDLGFAGYNGAPVDENGTTVTPKTQAQVRHQVLWGNFMGGGGGIECYFGYQVPETDLTLQNFRSRDAWWNYCSIALNFFRNSVPFWLMENRNDLIGNAANNINNGYCFAKTGDLYVVYTQNGSTKNLNLTGVTGDFKVMWFSPRNGGAMLTSNITTVAGGGTRNLGTPPNNTTSDWVMYIIRDGYTVPANN